MMYHLVDMFWNPFLAVRFGILAYFTYKVALGIWPFIRPSSLHKYQRQDRPAWAMITGATDGIGHALAEELLRRRFNVVIHGRNSEKLNRIRSAFLEQFPAREIQIWAADATGERVDYNEIVRIVQALPGKLTILINNVGGVPPPALATLEEATAEHINTIISLNTRFTAILTSRLLPVLKANSPSAIVCSDSGGALVGMPYIVTYGASKSFVHAFCNSLKAELASPDENEKAAGVNVNALVIGQVSTANSGVPPSFFVLRPDEFASAALHKIGCSQTQVAGHWRHALQSLIMTTLPESLLISMAPATSQRKASRREARVEEPVNRRLSNTSQCCEFVVTQALWKPCRER